MDKIYYKSVYFVNTKIKKIIFPIVRQYINININTNSNMFKTF